MYYKIYKPYDDYKFEVEENNIKKYGFCASLPEAIESYKKELYNRIEDLLEDVEHVRTTQKEFTKWSETL